MNDSQLKNILILLVIGAILYFVVKPRLALGGHSYSNEEEWEIIREPDGTLKKIVVHRNAKEI